MAVCGKNAIKVKEIDKCNPISNYRASKLKGKILKNLESKKINVKYLNF